MRNKFWARAHRRGKGVEEKSGAHRPTGVLSRMYFFFCLPSKSKRSLCCFFADDVCLVSYLFVSFYMLVLNAQQNHQWVYSPTLDACHRNGGSWPLQFFRGHYCSRHGFLCARAKLLCDCRYLGSFQRQGSKPRLDIFVMIYPPIW